MDPGSVPPEPLRAIEPLVGWRPEVGQPTSPRWHLPTARERQSLLPCPCFPSGLPSHGLNRMLAPSLAAGEPLRSHFAAHEAKGVGDRARYLSSSPGIMWCEVLDHGRRRSPGQDFRRQASHLGRGTSRAGFREKKPVGTSLKPARWTDITGQSSGRGMCVTPIVYHSTTSRLTSDRFARIHRGNPSSPRP